MRIVIFIMIAMPSILMASSDSVWHYTISELISANPGKSGVVSESTEGGEYGPSIYYFSEKIDISLYYQNEICTIGDISKIEFQKDKGLVCGTIPPFYCSREVIDVKRDLKNQILSYTPQTEFRYFIKDKISKRPFKVEIYNRRVVSKCQ